MEFGTPSTSEEIHACKTSNSGVICVVKDKGSKFGTYVSVDEQLLEEHQSGHEKDTTGSTAGGGDETGDEETDDEGAVGENSINYVELSEKQIRAVHLLSDNADDDSDNATSTNTVPKFQKLAAHQSIPLLQLSHTPQSPTAKSSNHVIILFGPQGSAIRLSLLPLQFTFSRIKKTELDPILSSLHYIGAVHSTQWNVRGSTHLVAPEKTAAAKGIMAYACRRPVVTKGFIEALLERRSPEDGLPKEDNYCPGGTWDKNLKYTAEPSTALKGYRIAVMVDDDNAPLAQSAGADILPIHEDAPSYSHAEFEVWWGTQMRRALDDKLALAVVSSSSKRCKHFSDWLKHYDGGVVRFTNAKNIAKAITNNNGQGELLMDARKVAIEKIVGWDDEKGVDGGKVDDTKMSAVAIDAQARDATTAAVLEEENENFFDQTYQDYENPPPVNDECEQEEPIEKEMPVTTRRKRRQEEEAENGGEEVQEEQPERQKRRRKNGNEEVPEKDVRAEEEATIRKPVASKSKRLPIKNRTRKEAEDRSGLEADENPAAAKVSKKSSAIVNNRRVDDGSSDDEPGIPMKRIPLPTTKDGWLVAAPKKRKAYRKETIDDTDNDVPDAAAETEKVSGLIVRKYIPPDKSSAGRTGNSKNKKKDFKRFRKNSVLRGYTTFNPYGRRNNSNQISSLPEIRLVDVMPKESERQRQLQQQQEDLEREQELADQLFNDGGGAKSGKKRGGAGGIRAFLTHSTVKKSRGRR